MADLQLQEDTICVYSHQVISRDLIKMWLEMMRDMVQQTHRPQVIKQVETSMVILQQASVLCRTMTGIILTKGVWLRDTTQQLLMMTEKHMWYIIHVLMTELKVMRWEFTSYLRQRTAVLWQHRLSIRVRNCLILHMQNQMLQENIQLYIISRQ